MSKPSETREGARNIPTRYAIVIRAKKLLKEIDDYFEDASHYGLTVQEADPTGEMMGWRKGIIAMLVIGYIKLRLSRNPAPQVPAMATSGASGQNVGADRPTTLSRKGLCDERPAGGSNPAVLDHLKWALMALELAANGLRNKRGLVVTDDPNTSDTELWNLRAAKRSVELAIEQCPVP